MELRREGKSYTVDTLREISRGNPGRSYFLVGTDMLLYMEQWYEFRALFSLCTLAALPRADGDLAEIERYAAYLRETYGARIEIIAKNASADGFYGASRGTAAARRYGTASATPPIPEIIRCRLYDAKPDLAWLREKTDAYLKPTRIPHVRGCEETAARLALRWGEDSGGCRRGGHFARHYQKAVGRRAVASGGKNMVLC